MPEPTRGSNADEEHFWAVAALRGALLEVICDWADDHECGVYGVDETDRLRLVDMLAKYLISLHKEPAR